MEVNKNTPNLYQGPSRSNSAQCIGNVSSQQSALDPVANEQASNFVDK